MSCAQALTQKCGCGLNYIQNLTHEEAKVLFKETVLNEIESGIFASLFQNIIIRKYLVFT